MVFFGPFLSGHFGIRNEVPQSWIWEFISDHSRIDFPVEEHLDEILAGRRALDDRGISIFRDMRFFKCNPFDLVKIDPIVVRQNSPHPHARRHGIGANAYALDRAGLNALEEALASRQYKSAEALLFLGVKPVNAEKTLREAVLRGDFQIVRLLVSYGAKPDAYLHDAALKGHKDIVELLIERGAKIDGRNTSGGTALHDAALGGHADVAGFLLDKGANVNARDTANGATPLYHAASWGRASVVELLLARGADRSIAAMNGQTPLKAALEAGHAEAAAILRNTAK